MHLIRAMFISAAAATAGIPLPAALREFHQEVDYRIEARLDESTNLLTGRAELRYTNHAPKALDTLYFHLHLNAFRPNSEWARRELDFNNRRFQDLGPDDYAFERVSRIVVNGTSVRPHYPFAPDSTVMAVPLSAPLRAGHTTTIALDWTARLSTTPRRQGRKGRHYDWAQWYPRIAVFDTAGWQTRTLVPQGEFFGEFASYDVTLDVAPDQIIGATGVPVSGDPGWQKVNRSATAPVLKRDAYPARAVRPLGLLGTEQSGRKRVRWIAERVHHFAWLTDPAFVYEGGQLRDIALHVLYVPGDSLWPGAALEQVKQSIDFYESVLGPYAYPQLTTARRVEGGATEFPMLTMHGLRPAIVHETGHEWAHAILANNEFRDGWLDEGLVSFLGFMFAEATGNQSSASRLVAGIARIDSAGSSQPVATPGADFHDFNLYQQMTYTKASLVFRMLRWYVGDADFGRGLKLYYEKNKLQHVDENDFRVAMEQATQKDLGWFFDQWLHTTHTLDFAVAAAVTSQQPSGAWRTQVRITRAGDIWMPVDLQVGDKTTRIASRDRTYTAVVETSTRPDAVVLDPESILIDVQRQNNRALID